MTSSDISLPFAERIQLAKQEQTEIFKARQEKRKKKARDILDTVYAFVDDIMEEAKEKYIKAVHDTNTNRKRQTVQLWDYYVPPKDKKDKSEGYNVKIKSVNEDGEEYFTPRILTHSYERLVGAFYPEENKSVKELLQERFNTPEFNNGIDPITLQPLHVCILTWKTPNSVFKNGIILSRDGVKYDDKKKTTI